MFQLDFDKDTEKMIGVKSISCVFKVQKMQFFSCSCGYSSLYDSDMDKCPNCGNSDILMELDAVMDTWPLSVRWKVIRDDEKFFAVHPEVIGLQAKDFHVKAEEIGCRDIIYNRKMQMICACDEYDVFVDDFTEYEYGVTELTEIIPYTWYDTPQMFWDRGSQFYAMIEEFCHQAGIDKSWMDETSETGYEEFFNELSLHINFRWLEDMDKTEKSVNLDRFRPSWNYSVRDYFKLRNAGVRNEKDTVLEAWGFTAEELDKMGSMGAYEEISAGAEEIKKSGLGEPYFTWIHDVPKKLWKQMFELAEKSGNCIEDVIRHIHLGTINGTPADEIIKKELKAAADGTIHLINMKAGFTQKAMCRHDMIAGGYFTENQYKIFQENPTLHTLAKLTGTA